ncbi:MAG TPA: sigma-70 family RNA polymerase sigma factor [Candidatus Saccharimonadales bacterium]|nr:sigma-70 family RNA polymerase sigma factor [Candidatus Saccharimonadales bacterium]
MSSLPNIERLYDDHAPALFPFLLNVLRNEADTYDVMQEVFAKLARRSGLLDGVRDERGFLLRLAHNAAIDLMRRQGTRARNYAQLAAESAALFASSADPDEQVFREKLAEALGELPPDQRAIVHLKLWEKLTFQAIAETLEIPPNTAASRYRYGIDKLRERLRPIYDEIK